MLETAAQQPPKQCAGSTLQGTKSLTIRTVNLITTQICICAVQASMSAALERAQFELKPSQGPGVIVVCGSLHAVAEAQNFFKSAS